MGDVGKFTNIRKVVDITNIKSASGHTHKVHAKGNAIVAYQDEIIFVSKVLYVPKVKKNLFLVGVIANMECIIVFGKAKC
jgi:hypothetical protein